MHVHKMSRSISMYMYISNFYLLRVQVDKLWRQGENVSSGAVASDSRVSILMLYNT